MLCIREKSVLVYFVMLGLFNSFQFTIEMPQNSYNKINNADTSEVSSEESDNEDTIALKTSIISNNKDVIDLSFYGMALFGKPDSQFTGNRLDHYASETSAVNPEELGSYLEGDILVPGSILRGRSALPTKSLHWPNGTIPIEINGTFKPKQLRVILKAIDAYHKNSCIRFIAHTNEKDYVVIGNNHTGCWSSIGRVGGKQIINLQTPACVRKPGTVIHEMMHSLGFLHEQNRKERDNFVDIKSDNISPMARVNFNKINNTIAFNVTYDYGSVMHYSMKAFSSNGEPTIVPLKPNEDTSKMGQRDGFSYMDLQKINRMYCEGKMPTNVEIQSGNSSKSIAFHPIDKKDIQPDIDSALRIGFLPIDKASSTTIINNFLGKQKQESKQ